MSRKARKYRTDHLRDPKVVAKAAAARKRAFALKRRAREEAGSINRTLGRPRTKPVMIDRSGLQEVSNLHSSELLRDRTTKVSAQSAEGKTRLRMATWLSKQAAELLDSVTD